MKKHPPINEKIMMWRQIHMEQGVPESDWRSFPVSLTETYDLFSRGLFGDRKEEHILQACIAGNTELLVHLLRGVRYLGLDLFLAGHGNSPSTDVALMQRDDMLGFPWH